MTSNQKWLLVIFIQETHANPKNWTRDPPDDTFHLRGLSVQA